MVKRNPGLICLTCFITGAGAILSLISLGTQEWIVGSSKYVFTAGDQVSNTNYGLFHGVFRHNMGGSGTAYEITMTCIYSHNVCALLCKNTAEERKKLLYQIYQREFVKFDENCPKVQKTFATDVSHFISQRAENPVYISAGSLISTIVFIVLSVLFGICACILAIWNTVSDPPQKYLNIFGIAICNAVACICIIIAVSVWSGEYIVTISKNLCILNTITGVMDSHGRTTLGFSYWLNVISIFLYITSLVMLYLRHYFGEKEPPKPINQIEESNRLYNYNR